MKKPCISVIGTGYVGLCTAVGFASKGYKVVTSTHNAEKAATINKGIPPFFEPTLQEMLKKTVQNGHLKCMLNQPVEAVLSTDITFNTIGTPSRSDGSIDLQHIEKSTQEIGDAIGRKDMYHVVVVKSTVVPGTTQNTIKSILENHSGKQCGQDFGLCMNPEFLREGSALEDTFLPDRIVIGEHDRKSGDTLKRLYKDFYGKNTPPILRTNLSTAELIKYASNALLATKISFINIIANMCEKIPGADVAVVAKGIGLDKRIGLSFLNAGFGYGGSCFPKDVKALIAYSKSLGYEPEVLKDVEEVNREQPLKAVEFCEGLLGDIRGKRISILGLSFKPNTNDMREAKSIYIIDSLLEEGAHLTAYDPVAIPIAKTIFKDKITYAKSALECLKEADCCILVTEWDEFKKLTPEDFKRHMKQPILIDGRRIYNPEKFGKELRFRAIGIGPKDERER